MRRLILVSALSIASLVSSAAPALAAGGTADASETESPPEDSSDDGDDGDDDRKMYSFGVRLGYWLNVLDAKIDATNLNVAGTNIDFRNDLDFDEPVSSPQVEVFLTTRFISLYVDYFLVDREEDTTLDVGIAFDGLVFNAGVPIETELTIESIGGRLLIAPLSFENFEFGALIGARYYRISTTIRNRGLAVLGAEASETVEAPLPGVGLSLRVFLGFLELYGYGLGFAIDYENDDRRIEAEYFEGEVGAAINFGDHFALMIGFRGIYAKVEEEEKQDNGIFAINDPNNFEVRQQGPVINLRVRF